MSRRIASCLERCVALAAAIIVLVGCAPPIASLPPTVSPSVADLTALVTPVQVARTNSAATSLAENQTVAIGIDDQIQVPESGHGVLEVGDSVTADVLRGSEVVLSEARPEAGGALFARLTLDHGHTRVALRESAKARVRLETGFGTITTLQPGTEFMVCQDPTSLTCLVVVRGEVEAQAQGKVVRVKAGEGTYILKGKAPFPAICAHLDQVNNWFDSKLGTGDIEALGALVASWPQESCAAATASAASVTATGSPAAASTAVALPAKDGMLKIPAGAYTIGHTAADEYHIPPMQKQLAAFWIDIHEVTNGQYQAFLDATSHATPVVSVGKKEYPVAGVTWNDAAAFCAWANKRLPTEAEWEVAGRGPGLKPPLYPWGDDPVDGGKIDSLPLTETYQVGSMAFNVSPFGVFDMAGNLWEWVGDPYYPVNEGMKVLRGGRYGFIEDMAYRQQAEPNNVTFVRVAGFRCAADKVQGG